MNLIILFQILVPILWISITVRSLGVISFPVLPHHVTHDRSVRQPPVPGPNILLMHTTKPRIYRRRASTAPVISFPDNPTSRSGLDVHWTSETGRLFRLSPPSTRAPWIRLFPKMPGITGTHKGYD